MTIIEVHYYDAYSPSLSTPFLPGKTEVKWSEAIQKTASIRLKITEKLAYG